MSRAAVLRISFVMVLSVVLAGVPQSSFAQHGGHGGGGFHGGGFGGHSGGSFHGGGGSFHGGGGFGGFRGGGGFHGGGGSFHDGRGFGGFPGGDFGGFHDGRGFGGFHGGRGFGGFRGNRFFGGYRGYGLGFGFGFWPYWDAYPYYYGYSPWWGAPYPYYPYDRYDPYDPYSDPDYHCRPDYRYPDNRCNDGSPDNSKPRSQNGPARPSSTAVPESSPDRNYVTRNVEDYRSSDSNDRTAPTPRVASNYQLAFATQELPSGQRAAVRNAIQALRAMPPDARQRQLNSGRFDSFSPEERELLNRTLTEPASGRTN